MILTLTSLPGSVIPSAHGIPDADKFVHFGLYAVFGALLTRARQPAASKIVVLRVLLAIAVFAALDEWHQQFIPGRDMDVLDWVADMAGAATGILTFLMAHRRRERTT
ncbi:MAG: VanZ family protein [Gemmatimonadaceae bacterium]